MEPPLKVFFSCTGIGIINRGIESFFREAFDGLKDMPGLDITLYKGAGDPAPGERTLWNVPRTQPWVEWLGRRLGRNGYVVEQWSSFPAMVREIRRHRPEVIFYSDLNLGFLLYRFRLWIGVPFRLLYSNGGPTSAPFVRRDYVQQVVPLYLEEALAAGEPPEKHRLVPYGIHVPPGPPPTPDDAARRALRARLGLPPDRPVLLSVGWISAVHKRMDYVVQELSRVPGPRPFLVLLGAMDNASPPIVRLARERLGEDGFAARSVPYAEVVAYYAAADAFTLASLQEGFGRVFLEALMAGLPCLVHDGPVMRYVLGEEGFYGDFRETGALAALIAAHTPPPGGADATLRGRRRESVRARFGWPVLAPQYRTMFEDCARRPPRG